MTVSYDYAPRSSASGTLAPPCLEDRFEVLKDIGDGSFGSVVSARVRTGGAHVARRGTIVWQPRALIRVRSGAMTDVLFLRSPSRR